MNMFTLKFKQNMGLDEEKKEDDGECDRCQEFQCQYNGMMALLLETLNDIIHVAPTVFSQGCGPHEQTEAMQDNKNSTGGFEDFLPLTTTEEDEQQVLLDVDTQTDLF